MRIISGKFKGYKLYITKDKLTRPLKDITKEGIFNVISHSNKINLEINKINVLDLYSGTGSFGLECLSRGVKKVYFVENNLDSIKILKKNIKKLNFESQTKIYIKSVENFLQKKDRDKNLKFELIFFDPPFIKKNIKVLIDSMIKTKKISKGNLIIFHRHKNSIDELTNNIKIIDEKLYGNSKIIFAKLIF